MAPGGVQNYLEARRLRLFVAGEGYGVYDYKLEMDFNGHSSATGVFPGPDAHFHTFDTGVDVKDAYVGIREIPLLGYVRVGHFKEVTSLEEQTHENYTTFMERSLPVLAFHPGRQFGVAAYNHTADEQFTLSSGAFIPDVNEDGRFAADDELGLDMAARVTWNPWYTAEGRGVLHVGGGYNYRDFRNDTGSFVANPEINQVPTPFGAGAGLWTGDLAVDSAGVMNFEAAMVYGGFSIQSEVFLVGTKATPGFADSDFYGASVQAS